MDDIVNNYFLKSKDFILAEFSLKRIKEVNFGITSYEYSIEIKQIYTEYTNLFPKNLGSNFDGKKLLRWINHRKVPKNRQFVDKLLTAIDDDNPMKYVDISHALSLNDAYWVSNVLDTGAWKDYNLYDHPFDEILSYVAFTGYSRKISGVRTTPELTSSGMLKKCWSNRPNGIVLVKGDDFIKREDKRSQATLEFYAAQVAEAMGLNHIDYDLEEFKHHNNERELVCTCPIFTTEDVGFVDAATCLKAKGIDIEDIDLSSFKAHIKIGEILGWEAYADMMLFDSIIANQDRHLGNFGMLVDNNTGEFIKMAPIFDNGFSLFYGASVADLQKENLEAYKQSLRCKYLSLDTQTLWFVAERHLPKLRKLLNFTFARHPKYNISEETLKLMENFVQERARRAIELYHEKE